MSESIQFQDSGKNKIYPISCEIGSNSNGSYVKFADGTLICYIKKNVTVSFNEQLSANMYRAKVSNLFTFPANFIEEPIVSIQPCLYSDGLFCWIVKIIMDKAKISTIELLRGDNSSGTISLCLLAIGRWK